MKNQRKLKLEKGGGGIGGIGEFSVSQTEVQDDDLFNNSSNIISQITISSYGKTLLENADLKIISARKYGLVGPNGVGKTTLLKHIVTRQLKIPAKIDCIYVEQEAVASDTSAVKMILSSDVKRTYLLERQVKLLESISEEYTEEVHLELEHVSSELKAICAETAESRVNAILSGLGFTPEMQITPTKFLSGGWRMRVAIAQALYIQPTLLLLDEPTNHLDLNAVIWLNNYLQKWKNTLLVVSHDQDFLDSVCTDVIHLDQRKLFYYRGNYEMFKTQYKQTREKQLKEYIKQQKQIKLEKKSGKSNKKINIDLERESRPGRHGRLKRGNKKDIMLQTETHEKCLLEKPKEYEVRFEFPQPSDIPSPLIQVKDVSFNYSNNPKKPMLFKSLNFGIDMESRVTIVGSNGVGKSTLLKLITQELEPTGGEILVNRHLRIARYHQHFIDILPMDKTPVEFLVDKYNCKYQIARNRLGKFGLIGTSHTIKMTNLSGGQKSRVVFASISFQEPHIIILDEPTNNLDIESIDALSTAINEYDGGIVLVSHDARLIQSTGMVLWLCENNSVTELQGDFEDYKNSVIREIDDH